MKIVKTSSEISAEPDMVSNQIAEGGRNSATGSRALRFKTRSLRIENIPPKPGVYFFVSERGAPLYIGKAANLRSRLRSYFSGERSEKVRRLVAESRSLKILPLESEIAAILEEAKWIKRVRPKYNVLLRDDKNYFYVGITRETFPRIFITHQPQRTTNDKRTTIKLIEYIGPFVNGGTLKKVLKLIRSYFPYCTCRAPHARICLSSQLGLCPRYCCATSPNRQNHSLTLSRDPFNSIQGRPEPSRMGERVSEYREVISRIRAILRGNIAPLRRDLEKKIGSAAREQKFELASEYRRQYEGLKSLEQHRGFIESFTVAGGPVKEKPLEQLAELLGLAETPEKIEVYDVSMISGANAVGAMTAFMDGRTDKSAWRLFRIRGAKTQNDPAMLAEVISRRLSHPEWSYPDLIIADGGTAQLNAARNAVRKVLLRTPLSSGPRKKTPRRFFARETIPVISIAKGAGRKNDRLIFGAPPQSQSFTTLPQELAKFLGHIRDETHRFAVSYHRKRREIQLIH